MKVVITGQRLIAYVLMCLGFYRSVTGSDGGFQALALGWLILIRADVLEMRGDK